MHVAETCRALDGLCVLRHRTEVYSIACCFVLNSDLRSLWLSLQRDLLSKSHLDQSMPAVACLGDHSFVNGCFGY